MIKREIIKRILGLSKKIPVITITGPRQSGKTTLSRLTFPNYRYVNLEEPDKLDFALSDPIGFLKTYGNKIVIDEVQYAPKLFSYIQSIVDEKKSGVSYILTGSQNFLLHSKISQSLAGRVLIFNLLPLSIGELINSKKLPERISGLTVKGFYPRIYGTGVSYTEWYQSYIQTYLERDVRQIVNVGNINMFRKFLRICAGRCGQVLNLSSIGNDLGISYQTVKKWLSVLEQSFIIFLLQPYYENFNKRILKSPKLYFYDTGLVCSLLGINTPESYELHYLKGNIFESFVISELYKYKFNNGMSSEFYYWKDSNGNEIDCIVSDGINLKAIEIKAGETVKSDFFKNLYLWNNLNPKKNINLSLVHGSDENQLRGKIKVLGWKNCTDVLK